MSPARPTPYSREVSLFHLLQQDLQGPQVQDYVIGFLQAWGGRALFSPEGAAVGSLRPAAPFPRRSPSLTFL